MVAKGLESLSLCTRSRLWFASEDVGVTWCIFCVESHDTHMTVPI